MSYASDLGLKVGSKIKVIGDGVGCCFNDGDIIELVEDDGQTNPYFTGGGSPCRKAFSLDRYKWEHYKEEDKDTTKLKFPCCVATSEIKDEETFKKILDLFVANGAERKDKFFSYKDNWKWFGVDIADMTTQYYDYSTSYEEVSSGEVTIYTLEQLLAFLPKEEAPVAQVTTLLPRWTEVKIAETSCYYGGYPDSPNPKDTKGTIIELDEDDDEFCYIVKWENGKRNSYGLNDLVLWEETLSVASQEAITDVSNSKPSVGIDSSDSGYKEPTEPLVSITKEVKYTVTIKGIDFTFTQDELSELTEELLGFSDDF